MKKTLAIVFIVSIFLSFMAGYFFAQLYFLRINQQQWAFLSFTFDDNRMGQYVYAKSILDEAGFKATFYVTRDNFNADSSFFGSSEVKELYNDGHEIGSHTKTHRDLTHLSETEIRWEIDSDYLRSLGISPRTFAYPYGSFNNTVMRLVSQYYDYARTSGSSTTMHLESQPLNTYGINARVVEKDTSVTDVKSWIDEAITSEKWLIITFHNIVELPSSFTDYSISGFQEIVTYAKEKGIIVKPLVEIADQLPFQSR